MASSLIDSISNKLNIGQHRKTNSNSLNNSNNNTLSTMSSIQQQSIINNNNSHDGVSPNKQLKYDDISIIHENELMYNIMSSVYNNPDQYLESDIIEPQYTNQELQLLEQFKQRIQQRFDSEQPWNQPPKYIHWIYTYKQVLKNRNAYNVDECNRIIDIIGQPSDGRDEYNSSNWQNHILIKFIRARKHNIDAAVDMYYNYVVWRAQKGVSDFKKINYAIFHSVTSSFVSHTW